MNSTPSFTLRFDLRLVCLLLLVALISLSLYTKPWEGKASARTISVTGQATIEAQPDQFSFQPSYEKKAVTSTDAVSQVSDLGNQVVAKMKELGIEEKQIKTSVSSRENYEPVGVMIPEATSESDVAPSKISDKASGAKGFTASYQITATTTKKEIATKVQNYLAGTPVLYQVTAEPSFSNDAQKKLLAEARQKAIADAKAKAEATATELSVKLGKVISVSEPNQFGGPIMLQGNSGVVAPEVRSDAQTAPIFQPGSQELSFSVSVVYRIK